MDSNKISNWLQVAGNFGLLAGLALVVVQINQKTEISRADLTARSRTGTVAMCPLQTRVPLLITFRLHHEEDPQ